MTLFGLIGRPLGHSFSARYFNDKFGQEDIPARYELCPLESIAELPALIATHPGLRGLNVTIPYKVEVIPYLDSLSEEAEGIGAVNVIKIERDGDRTILKGFNSDAYGFSESLRHVMHREEALPSKPLAPEAHWEGALASKPLAASAHWDRALASKPLALVLGSGGASKAIVWSLRQMGFIPIVVGRTRKEGVISYSDLTPEMVYDALAVVNCTPVGMSPNVNAAPPFPFQYLHAGQVCFDLIYNPEETLFMKLAKSHGCVVSNGLEMLRLQADRSWQIWTDEDIPIA